MDDSEKGASPILCQRISLKIGDRFGKWTMLETPVSQKREVGVSCQCDCGAIRTVLIGNLITNKSSQCKSCSVKGRSLTHGDSLHGPGKYKRLYGIWYGMRRRCDPSYRFDLRYHSKGIIVCDEWLNSYMAFKGWALANGYADHLSIDRYPDKNGDYEPSNCRWATDKEQSRNKNNNRILTAFGESKALCEWAEDSRCAINRETLNARVNRGWPHEWAIKAPLGSFRR